MIQICLICQKIEITKPLHLFLRLSDFATIIEGNQEMKAGDIARLMNIWKCWSVIANGVPKLQQ